VKYAAIDINFDSLWKDYGFLPGYRDPSFFEVSKRFFNIAGKYKFKYSIYIIGKDLEKSGNRESVKEWASQGHEIGNHSWSHPLNLGAMSKSEMRREVEMSHEIITKTTGCRPKGFISPAWSASPELLKILIELNYTYDTSGVPSWLMFPALSKILLDHCSDRQFFKLLHRKDFLYFLFGSRKPYLTAGSLFKSNNSRGITMLPLPANKYRIACWHTLVFMFGWKIHEMILQSCLKDVDAFYYLIHPADLMDERDLPGRKVNIARIKTPLELKQAYLEKAIEIILKSGRQIITMEELAKKYRNAATVPL
jgi:hypothetical protein